ncbi:MAG: glycosyltransferase family 4 protein [Massilia sp.]
MSHQKRIVMLGTSCEACGGISSVVNAYREGGLFERRRFTYLATHSSGSALHKMRLLVCAWLSFVALLASGRVLLAHVHCASDASFWRKSCFLLPAFLFRVRTILHIHAGPFPDFYRTRCSVARAVVRYVLDRVDRVVVVSTPLQRFVESVSTNRSVKVIYNPMPMPPLADFGRRDHLQLLFLGRLGHGKGSYDLLRAVHELVRRHPNVRLILAGDGEIAQTRAAIRALRIDANVQVLGWVGPGEREQLLARAAICVLPSYAEGLPMCVLEAMAAGVPVVASAVGGVPDVLADGIEGLLVQPGDVAALAAALDQLLSGDSLRRRMGMAARWKAESTFSTRLVLPQIEETYRQLGADAQHDAAAGPAWTGPRDLHR